jgi:hypothetical protein
VLARKGVLISNPDVRRMTRTQWLFEYFALIEKDKLEQEIFVRNAKAILVNVLGLNAIRPEHENGVPKKWEEMTDEEKEGFLPLSLWMGREDMLKRIKDQWDTEKAIDDSSSDKQYEELVKKIDEAGGDMEPVLDTMFDRKQEVDNSKLNVEGV